MKKCPPGKYYCTDRKKCMPIPRGYYVGRGGWLEKDKKMEMEMAKRMVMDLQMAMALIMVMAMGTEVTVEE